VAQARRLALGVVGLGMGNVGSTPLEEHLSVRTNQTSTYSAGPGTTYVPGTTLPVHGWMQPCSSCSTTTARTVGKSHKFLCRRCAGPPRCRELNPLLRVLFGAHTYGAPCRPRRQSRHVQ
jgi:hypothetical protein